MQLVEQHIIKRSNPIFKELDKMSFLSKNLYNQSLYQIRQEFFNTKKYLNYNSLANKFASENQIDYISLPRKVSQWVLKQVDKEFVSFFNSLKSNKINHKIHIPKYKDKNGRNLITFTNQAVSSKELKKGFLKLSGCESRIKIIHIDLQQVRVIPKGNCYLIEIVYNKTEKETIQNNNFVGIDLGLNNLATVGGNNIVPFIINGKPLKSINQYYNKQLSRLKSRQDTIGNKSVNSQKIKN